MIPLHVVVESLASRKRWEARVPEDPNLEIAIHEGATALRVLARLLRGTGRTALMVREGVVLGRGFGGRAAGLLAELDATVPGMWGACGNTGVSLDRAEVYRYSGPQIGLRRTRHPRLVAGLGPDVLLVNLGALRAAGVRLPTWGEECAEVALSLECLRAGLGSFVDSRLYALCTEPRDDVKARAFLSGKTFGRYWAERFVNHALDTPLGRVDLSASVDFGFLDVSETAPRPQKDVHGLEEAVVARMTAALEPTITIACRTLLNRPAMLDRAIASFATARARATDLDVRLRLLVPDEQRAVYEESHDRLAERARGLRLEATFVPKTDRYPRTEAMFRAFAATDTDYLWFVDDDDFLLPDALQLVRGAIQLGKRNLVLGDAVVYEETWSRDETGKPVRLEDWHVKHRYPCRDYLLSLAGTNYVPNCSVLFPTRALKPRLEGLGARGDYNEDFYFLLVALGDADAEVSLVQRTLAGISQHNLGNTVTEKDRTRWHESFASFVGELVNGAPGGSPIAGELARAYALAASDRVAVRTTESLQVYFASDGGFAEETSLVRTLEAGSHVQVHAFDVPEAFPGGLVRVDVGDVPGYVEVHEIELRGAWPSSLLERPGLGRRAPLLARNMVEAPYAGAGPRRYFATGPDPQLLFELPPHALETPLPGSPASSASRSLVLALRYVQLPELRRHAFTSVSGTASTSLVLFFGSAGTFSESRTAVLPIDALGESEEVTFQIPEGEIDRLRVDFGSVPAYLELHTLEIAGAGDHGPSWEYVRKGALPAVVMSHDLVVVSREDVVRLYATGADPYLVLDRPEAGWGSRRLRIRLRCFPLPGLLARGFVPDARSAPGASLQTVQLYVPERGTFSEQGSVTALLNAGEALRDYSFDVKGIDGEALRFDIGDGPGVAEIEKLELRNTAGALRVDWLDIGARLGAHNMVRLPGKPPLRFVATDADPYLLLGLPPGLPREPFRLDVSLRHVRLPDLRGLPIGLHDAAAIGFRMSAQELRLVRPSDGVYEPAACASARLRATGGLEWHRLELSGWSGPGLKLRVGEIPAYVEIHRIELRLGSVTGGEAGRTWSGEDGFAGVRLGAALLAARPEDGSYLGLVSRDGHAEVELELGPALAHADSAVLLVALCYRPFVTAGVETA